MIRDPALGPDRVVRAFEVRVRPERNMHMFVCYVDDLL